MAHAEDLAGHQLRLRGHLILASRLNNSQFQSFRIGHSSFLNYVKCVNRRILKLLK